MVLFFDLIKQNSSLTVPEIKEAFKMFVAKISRAESFSNFWIV
jgi:hypothetical protein